MEVESHAIHGKYMSSASCNHLTEFTWYPANSCGRLGSTGPYVIHKGSMDVNGISKYVRKTYSSSDCSGVPLSTVTFDTTECKSKGDKWSENYFWFDSTKYYNYEYSEEAKDVVTTYPAGKWYLTSYHNNEDCTDKPRQVHAIEMESNICTRYKKLKEDLSREQDETKTEKYVYGGNCGGFLHTLGDNCDTEGMRYGTFTETVTKYTRLAEYDCGIDRSDPEQHVEYTIGTSVVLNKCLPAYGGFYTKKSAIDQKAPTPLELDKDTGSIMGYSRMLLSISIAIVAYILV